MHKFKQDDIVLVFNQTMGGGLIYEGKAAIVKPLETDDQYEVRFVHEPNQTYERFVNFDNQYRLPLPLRQAYDEAKAKQAA